MHPNPIFRSASDRQNLDWARERGFGTLAVSAPEGPPMLSHVPFLLSKDGGQADLHLMRSNPIARACDVLLPARLAVTGPDGYISPDWYGIDDQVPTWNYVAVHLTGTLEQVPDTELREVLSRQSAFFEARFAPKLPWTMAKTDPGALDRLMRMILPFRLHLTGAEGTWKLSQNKPDAARESAASQLESSAVGLEPATLAAQMRQA